MLKSFGLIDNIWFDKSVIFPFLYDKYTIHNINDDNFAFKQQILSWEISQNNSTGMYPYVFEINSEFERADHNHTYFALKNLISLLRLIKYNRIYLAHMLSFESGKVTMSTSCDDPRPSNFLGREEEISKNDLISTQRVINFLREAAGGKKNLRLIRALNFLDSSSCSGTFERKVIELFITLESLFTTSHEEVTYKLSSRMAWLNHPLNRFKRTIMFQDIKKGYSIRSNIVHGKAFVESKNLPLINAIHSHTRAIFLKIISDEKLREVFSGSDEVLNSFFSALVMGNYKKT